MSKQVEAKRNWENKNIRLYSFLCNRTYDADIIEFMEQKENKYDYLRSLVRRDMQRTLEIESAKEVERPQGEWINQSQGAKYPCECSECHTEPLFDEYGNYDLSDFCPKCGADLRGGTR